MAKIKIRAKTSTDKTCSEPQCARTAWAQGMCGKHYQRARAAGLPVKHPHIKDFWDEVDKSGGPDACWPWMRGRHNKDGADYGLTSHTGWEKYAHRQAWVLANGPIPDGLDVLHSCDNPPCCNPKHLFLGTHSDNMQDKIRKGRANQPEGIDHPMAKLTEADVREIRRLGRTTMRQADIGRRFGISQTAAWAIISRKNWRHIE